MPLFSGVVPPLSTPLTNTGELDLDSFGNLIEFMIEAGVHGLFVLGTSGEATFHGEGARARIIERAVEVNDGRLPLFAGVIDSGTERMAAHARTAKSIGADVVVATAPFYAQVNQNEIADHFRYVRDAADLPLVAYDIPFCTHVKLQRSTVVDLVREGVVAGLKDSSGEERVFRQILLDLADHTDFFGFTGSELTVDSALAMGAHGVVPGLANIDPAGYVRLFEAFQSGDLLAVKREQERLCALSDITAIAMGRVGLSSALSGASKTALRELGVIATNAVARPQQSLNEVEARCVREKLQQAGLLN